MTLICAINKKEVVDRAGFCYLRNTNALPLDNRLIPQTGFRARQGQLANHSGPTRDANLCAEPDHQRKGVRHGYP
jgi:hypothetical protein